MGIAKVDKVTVNSKLFAIMAANGGGSGGITREDEGIGGASPVRSSFAEPTGRSPARGLDKRPGI